MFRANTITTNRRALVALLLVLSAILLIAAAKTATPAASLPGTLSAQQSPSSIKVSLAGDVMRDGKAISVDGLQVQPGEIIIWKMRVSNRGNQGIAGLRAEGMIPKGTEYIPSSGGGQGALVQFSIDGGRTYSPRPMIVVDGKPRPAPVESYNSILFTWVSEIGAGVEKTAAYRTRVR